MCGFAGVVTWDERYRVSPETLGKMTDSVAHRGPDGRGTFINHDQEISVERPQAAMGFRRLAVLDPEPRSDQPFGDGRYILVFNGEIYNFRELREELSAGAPEYQWRTSGDTEVVLRSFAVWGKRCVEKLNGMFALAIWDEEKKKLFVARDRMGQKPLYLTMAAEKQSGSQAVGALAFASEAPALLQLPWVDRRLDEEAVVEYLRWGCLPDGMSIYAGLMQLRPGMVGEVGRDGMTVYSYFKPNRYSVSPPAGKFSDEEAVRRTREMVRKAVERQLVSDVPLGCFLSGGVDSSVIAAAAAGSAGKRLGTFSIGFDDPRYDESDYARGVAEYLRTEHSEFVVRPDAVNDLPELARAYGEPFGDSSALPTFYLCRETRRQVKVALSGDGGDELFGGYDRYRAMRMISRARRTMTPLPWMAMAAVSKRAREGHPKSGRARFKRFVEGAAQPAAGRYSGFMRLMDDRLICRLMSRNAMTLRRDLVAEEFASASALDGDVRGAMYVDRVFYLPWDLLTKVDRASMRNGLEVRSPFMDHELVAFADGLSVNQLLNGGGKRMLREAFKDELPTWVFGRRKMGFAVPIGDWLRGELREMLRGMLFAVDSFAVKRFDMRVVQQMVEQHESGKRDHSQRLYALLMLELWWNGGK